MFWLGAAVALCYVPGITGASIATQWPLLSILLPLALWRSGVFTVFHAIGVLFLAFAALQTYGSSMPYDAVFGFWLLCIMGLSFWLGSTLDDVRGLYKGLAAGVSVSSAVAVFQWFGWQGLPLWNPMYPAGIFYNNVAFGAITALVIVALVSERLWLWTLPLIPGLLVCQSRGALLGLAVGIAAVYVRRLWVFGLVALAGLFLLLQPLGKSDAERMLIWETLYSLLTPTGYGPGSLFAILLPRPNGSWFFPEYAHNDALQLVFEHGFGALLPLFIFGYVLTRTAEREWPVIVAFSCFACFYFPLWTPVTSFLGLVVAGRIVRSRSLVWRECFSRRLEIVRSVT
jgi:hypothetical protein